MNSRLHSGHKHLADYKSERPKMSKCISLLLTLFAVLCLVSGGLVSDSPVAASGSQGASAAASTTKNAAIVAATQAVLKETSALRELGILRPVKSGAQSRAEIERMIIRNLKEQTTPAEMHATEAVLKKLGLVPQDFQYQPFVINLLTEQVAGYYDPKTQQFFLADWIELEGQKPVMAHELTHALQDQHFNLRRFEKWPKGDSDAQLAAHALIEGDATLAMTVYMARNPLVALAFMKSFGAAGTPSEQFKQAPRAIRDTLIFPYEKGAEWATQLYKRGGWKLISQAFNKLPLSSEQILHPEKYFAYEMPVKVTLPELGSVLGAGWKRIDYDVNGEWGLYLILDEFLQTPSETKRAAAGWGGDRYTLYEGPEVGDILFAQMTVWDTENDAREFFEAYEKRIGFRYRFADMAEPPVGQADDKADEHTRLRPDGEGVVSASGLGADVRTRQMKAWQTKEGRVVLELHGNRVLVIEGIPESVEVKTLLKTLWG